MAARQAEWDWRMSVLCTGSPHIAVSFVIGCSVFVFSAFGERLDSFTFFPSSIFNETFEIGFIIMVLPGEGKGEPINQCLQNE